MLVFVKAELPALLLGAQLHVIILLHFQYAVVAIHMVARQIHKHVVQQTHHPNQDVFLAVHV